MNLAYKLLGGLLLLIATASGGYYEGHHIEVVVFEAYKANIKSSASEQKAVSAAVTTKIVTQYVPQIQVVHEKGATIIKQVKVYVPTSDDNMYHLPIGFVRLHDAAATGVPLPESASSVLAHPSPIAISTAASVITSNYQLCRTEREKYNALWQWAEQQHLVTQK